MDRHGSFTCLTCHAVTRIIVQRVITGGVESGLTVMLDGLCDCGERSETAAKILCEYAPLYLAISSHLEKVGE